MAEPVLALLERNIWRRRSVLDTTQVAASGATVSFYGQGATFSGQDPVDVFQNDPTPTTLPLFDRGDIVAGDYIQHGFNTGAVMRVVEVEGRDTIKVVNVSALDISISEGSRLVRLNDRPSVYADPHGMRSLGPEVIVSDGRLSVYIAAERFDYIVSGAGLTTALYRDAMGGSRPNPSWVAVLDHHLDLQAAIDALPPTGGEIFLPSGSYVLPSTLLLNKDNVCLRGQGSNTIITGPANPNFDLVRIERRYCRLQDLQIDGNASSAAAGKSCLVVTGAQADMVFLKNLLLKRASKHGVEILNSGSVFGFNCESLENLNSGYGLQATGTPLMARLVACAARGNAFAGVTIDGNEGYSDGVTLLGCLLEGGVNAAGLNGLQIVGCRLAWASSGTSPLQILRAYLVRGLVVEGCWFDGKAGVATEQASLGAELTYCSGPTFAGNVGVRLSQALVSFGICTGAVEFGNQDLDSAVVRILTNSSTLFSLSRGVVEPFRYESTPPVDDTWRPGTMFWDQEGLRVVIDDEGTLKRVNFVGL